jgi:hypothetical protein
MLDTSKIQSIALEIIKTLASRFESFPTNATINRNAPFHEAFLNAFTDKFSGSVSSIPFFLSLSSWMHGLNTTLGQTFFEQTAHILADAQKKEFKGLLVSSAQQTEITNIITELKNGTRKPNLRAEESLIYTNNLPQNTLIANFTADCFYEDALQVVCIELKTVKPNSGIFKGEKEKILQAKAALKNLYPSKAIHYYLGFPFDPTATSPTGANKPQYMKYSVDFDKFFEPQEVLLAGELWDFLSDTPDTMQAILHLINKIAKPNFLTRMDYINDSKNIDTLEFRQILSDWGLEDEIVIVNKWASLIAKSAADKKLQKMLNQSIFTNGKYNERRRDVLIQS